MKHSFYLLIILLWSGCTSKGVEYASFHGSVKVSDFDLPDSLFPFIDLTSTTFEKSFSDNQDFVDYPDSILKFRLVELDTAQKRKFITPIFHFEMPTVDSDYSVHYLRALFISKQKKIGDFLPVIFRVEGDDYGALVYVLLDRSLTPVAHYIVSGGDCGGPDVKGKLIRFCTRKHSEIKGNVITSYTVSEVVMPDSIPDLSVFDSLNYVTNIQKNGKIETVKLDSVRYQRFVRRN